MGMRAGRICALLAVLLTGMASAAGAQQAQSRFLASEDILLYGIGLRVEPAQQTVPKDIATIVSTFLQAPTDPGLNLPPFAPDAVVRATLRGPGRRADRRLAGGAHRRLDRHGPGRISRRYPPALYPNQPRGPRLA